MTSAIFKVLCLEFVAELKKYAPKDTGNLAYNSIQYVFTSDNECQIKVNEQVAPYMVFTNEKWISPKWKGKPNPNEQWWNKAIEITLEKLAYKYGGILSRGTQST